MLPRAPWTLSRFVARVAGDEARLHFLFVFLFFFLNSLGGLLVVWISRHDYSCLSFERFGFFLSSAIFFTLMLSGSFATAPPRRAGAAAPRSTPLLLAACCWSQYAGGRARAVLFLAPNIYQRGAGVRRISWESDGQVMALSAASIA